MDSLLASGPGVERRCHRLHRALVIAEVGVAMVLLAGASLLIRSFVRMATLNPGFNPDHVMTLRIALPARRYATNQSRAAFYSQVPGSRMRRSDRACR